jgi:hypothetical protein
MAWPTAFCIVGLSACLTIGLIAWLTLKQDYMDAMGKRVCSIEKWQESLGEEVRELRRLTLRSTEVD